MKKAVFLLAVMFTVGISAQDIKPTFEKDGKMIKATYFHDNGEIAQTGFLLEGKLHGDWVMFDNEGKKIATGQYMNGRKSGKWFFWENICVNSGCLSARRSSSLKHFTIWKYLSIPPTINNCLKVWGDWGRA